MLQRKIFISLILILVSFNVNSQTKSWLHIEGNLIKDTAGNLVTLRGVSIIAPEYATSNPINPITPAEYIAWLADSTRGWYSRIVRIPVCGLNLTPAAAYNFINPLVQQAINLGLYVIIDFHNVTDYGNGGTSQRTVLNFWNYFAPKYADSSNVFFEVYNEPVKPADWNQWKSFIQPVVNAIRAVAPRNIILMGSPQWSTYCNYAISNPISGVNIVYVYHIYPNQGAPTSSLLDSKFGNAANSIPVMITEFGWNQSADYSDAITYGKTSNWGVPFRTYMDAHPTISWVNWVFDNYWEPSIFDENWSLMSYEDQGEFIKGWLADLNKVTTTGVETACSSAYQLMVYAIDGKISVSLVGLCRVDLYSITGKLLASVNAKGNTIELNASLAKGIYIVRAYNTTGLAITKKLLIIN
ncbi:MAG: cellulase family glycosylhydrolase [Bacteroidota bacterium]|nr:cellulase family glycosylhydrolase [Bacteroidota bacterium]